MNKLDAIKAFTAKTGEVVSALHLSKPWMQDGKVRATNGHILIELPAALLEENPFTPWDTTALSGPAPDFNKVLPAGAILNMTDFDQRLLEKALSSTEPKSRVVPPTEPCEDCDGKGEYHHGNCDCSHVCTECDGKGQHPNDNAGEIEFFFSPISMIDRTYDWRYLKVIMDAMNSFGGTWSVSLGERAPGGFSTSPTVFYSSQGVIIAIMECRP